MRLGVLATLQHGNMAPNQWHGFIQVGPLWAPCGLGCLRSSCCASLETSSMATLNRVHCQQQIQVPCQVIGLKRALTWHQCFTRFKRFDIFHGRGVCTINVQLSTLASSLSPCSFIRDTCRPSASRASPIDLVFLEKCQC